MLGQGSDLTQWDSLSGDDIECRHVNLSLSSGQVSLRYLGSDDKPLLICLHGWLDNSASFHCLAKSLVDEYQLLLVDLPGHGHSAPLMEGSHYYIWQYVEFLYELLDRLKLGKVNFLAHSMGGISASLFAGSFPKLVDRLILLDSLGPMSSLQSNVATQLAKSIKEEQQSNPASVLRIFPTINDALRARKKASPTISDDGLLPIVVRNLKSVEGGYSWSTDKRLRQTSKVSLTEEQVHSFFSAISADVLVLIAKDGIIPKSWRDNRLSAIPLHQSFVLPGHHHFHCESRFVSEISDHIKKFMTKK